ncbi:hypothetical protein ACL02O_08500 [Micromonospora sp. MS34]|uniref:hypothetical protein n=1 Tax=Micromonospora sp. MS34 TaxID=3385971 RepID=UPI0039A0CEC6
MALEITTRVRVDGGAPVERLMCHPRLPLVAGWDSERPTVRVWDHTDGNPRECGIVGADSPGYGEADGWDRFERTPVAAWHPYEPLLVVAVDGEVVQWTAGDVSALAGAPSPTAYHSLAFSPDGRTLWASPASGGGEDAWESSDVLDLGSATVGVGPRWDTGVAVHPGGGLLVTLRSDQGATYATFARVDGEAVPAAMRLLRRTLILDVDGYQTPIFSADGRHFAIRGNSYGHTVEVFAFPSLERVLGTTLGPPSPGYPYPDEWLEQMRAWSRHNIAFGARPGVLWVGTPAGVLVELDVRDAHLVEHDVLAGSPVTALAATATGAIVVADGDGNLCVVSVPAVPAGDRGAERAASQALVAAFVDETSEVPDDAAWEEQAVRTDGVRTWQPDDLATVTDATEGDPTWLQIHAAVNRAVAGADAPS